jgi:ribosomal-protein-alanine N-acetyltransferase
MIETLELPTPRLLLRTRSPADAPSVLAYEARIWPAIAPWMPLMDPTYFTLAAQKERLANEETLRLEGRGVRLYLSRRDDPQQQSIIGDIHLSNIVRGAFQSCFLGYKMDPAHMQQGYMTEAVRHLIDFAFNSMRLHRIEANIMPRNLASRRVVENCGFVNEGRSPKYLKINGVWEDHLHYVVLNPAEE